MSVANYLQRPTQYKCAKWDGTNQADITEILTAVNWSFTVDGQGNGTAHTPFGGTVPVADGTWVISGNGSPQFLADEDFTAQFVAGSTWSVVP